MTLEQRSSCRSCNAPVVWAWTPKGEKGPIDADPAAEKGNVLLLSPTGFAGVLAVVLSGEALERARSLQMQLRTNHYATCPDRQEWRQRTDAKKEAAGGG